MRTVRSVLDQELFPGLTLHYIIADGGSSDRTVSIVEAELNRRRGANTLNPAITVEIEQQTDEGMYDALSKQYKKLKRSYDLYAYINAGDYYSPYAIAVAANATREKDWITGLAVNYDYEGCFTQARLPWKLDRQLLQRGFYGTWLPHIQQESTFWTRKLQETIDLDRFEACRLAGDYYLWKTFSQYSELSVVPVWLGGFAKHEGQLSEVYRAEYQDEMASLADQRRIMDYAKCVVLRLCDLLPHGRKLKYGKHYVSASRFPACDKRDLIALRDGASKTQ